MRAKEREKRRCPIRRSHIIKSSLTIVNEHQTPIRWLEESEEVVGKLSSLSRCGNTLLAVVGSACIVFELDSDTLESFNRRLRRHVGNKVAILRVEDRVLPFRVRRVPRSNEGSTGKKRNVALTPRNSLSSL